MKRLFATVVALAALLTACGGSSATTTAAADAESADVDDATSENLIPTASGGQIDINALEGTDAVLWFWAPW